MDNDDDSNFSSLDVYKYRRSAEKLKMYINPDITRQQSDETTHNILVEIDQDQGQKTFAILQETGPEFTNSKLRYILLVYSNPASTIFTLFTLLLDYILETCLYTFWAQKERAFLFIVVAIGLNFIFLLDVTIIVGLKFSRKWRKTLNLVEPETKIVIFDMILALPYSVLFLIDTNLALFDIYVIAPIIATIRLYKIIGFAYNRSSQAGTNQWTIFLAQYLILLFLSVHTWTCVWYLFSYRDFDVHKIHSSWSSGAINLPTETTFDWYLVCLYWSIMFFTTNALGDLYPVTTAERMTALLAILLGFFLTTIVFVGSLTSQFITITTRRAKYIRRLRKIQKHLQLIKMDLDTTKRITRYYQDLWYQKSGVFKPKLMKLLPYPLQMEISYDLNAVPLYSSLIFRKLPEPFLRRLSTTMCHQFYLPGDVIYSHNQNKSNMICITSGVVEFLSDEDDESPMISFAKGTCFGEISLVYNIPARCTVKAATFVECQVLNKVDFIKLMITYPNLVSTIRNDIQERIYRSHSRKQESFNNSELSLNIFVSKDRKMSSLKCLKEKLRYRQGLKEVETSMINEKKFDETCLDLYILSEHIKKRTSLFTCLTQKFPWILESNCYLVLYWEIYMLLIVFYICIFYPYFIGIKRRFPGGFIFYVEIVVTVSLVINVIMSIITAVRTKKRYIKNISGILNYRLNTLGFYIDVISLVPFEYIVTIHKTILYRDNHREHLFYLCKGVKLCLIWRLSNFFEKLERKLLTNTIVVKVAKYCTYIIMLCYWSGVILFMESCFVNRCSEYSWFSRALKWENARVDVKTTKTSHPIVASVYFATALLSSVGYGDFIPGDNLDMGFVAFLSLYGVLLSGYCVSEFSAVVTHHSRTKTAFLEVIMTIDKFMQEHNMHRAIKSRIMAFYELQWQYNSGVELTDESWLNKTVIPAELRKKVLHQARFKTLTSIRFFQVKNKAYIHTLTEMARDIILPPAEIVYYGGTVTRELYIIESGYCLVTSQLMRETKTERIIGPGNHLGLIVMLYGVPAVNTVVTLTHCKLISIGHAAYNSVLNLFPEMREHEGLLTSEELKIIEQQAQSRSADSYLQHYKLLVGKSQKVRINNILQAFWNDSFINVYQYYKEKKESYVQSYEIFNIFDNVAPYVLMPIVIKPNGIFLKTWAMLRLIVAYLQCLLIPIVISMSPACGIFNTVIMVFEGICYIDLYLMFHVAYYGQKNLLIFHPYLTAKNYLTKGFVLDFLTCFPWYGLWILFTPKHDESHTVSDHDRNQHFYHCFLRMVNVLQIYRLYAAFWAESIGALKRFSHFLISFIQTLIMPQHTLYSSIDAVLVKQASRVFASRIPLITIMIGAYLMSVVQFLLLTVFFLNLYTSILISLSCAYITAANEEEFVQRLDLVSANGPIMKTAYNPSGNMVCKLGSWIDEAKIRKDSSLSTIEVYLLAYYWSVTSFSGAGFGDVTAQDTAHMILSICINIHGVLFFGYVYARIASLKAMADQVATKFQESLKHLDMFLNREKVPFSLKKSVIEYWKYQWKRTGGWSHQTILGKLHANLNEDAVLYMYEKTLREIPLFEAVEYSFFRAFAKKLKEQYFQKGYVVIRTNEVISNMYIIYRGKVDIISDINEVEACMGPGGIFGNIRGAFKYRTLSNVLASRNTDLLCIQGSEFYALLKSYPSVLRKVKLSLDSAPKDYVIPTIISATSGVDVNTYPLTYESGDEEEEITQNINLDSPERSINESHGSKSITSASNADYISAVLLCFLPHRWFRSSVIPDSKWVTFVDYFIIFLSYADFIILVYQMAFLSNAYFFYICIVSDVIFLYKGFLDIHTGYMNRYGDYVLNPGKVRKMYFSKVFLRRRDFLCNLPISYFAFALNLQPEMQHYLFCYLRTPQLVRITFLFTYKQHRKINIGSANLFLKLAKIVIWASILSHVNACLFFKLSCLTPVHCTSANWMSKPELNLRAKYSEGNFFALYITSLWYMVNLLTITGTGDVSSQNDFEVIETIVIITVIKFCTGLLISEMSAMISAHSSSRIAYDYDINELRDGLRDTDLSDYQMNKMWDYVRELWNRQQGRQMPELTYKLPFRLRCQVMQAVYGSHIRESVIFNKTCDDFKRMLSMWLKHCVFFPGNYIVQCGDADQCIYFIHRGEVEVLTVHANLTESIYDILGPEDSFGVAQGLFIGLSHHFSFRARTVVDIVYLKLDDWKYLLDFYPKSAKIVRRKVENVYLAI